MKAVEEKLSHILKLSLPLNRSVCAKEQYFFDNEFGRTNRMMLGMV